MCGEAERAVSGRGEGSARVLGRAAEGGGALPPRRRRAAACARAPVGAESAVPSSLSPGVGSRIGARGARRVRACAAGLPAPPRAPIRDPRRAVEMRDRFGGGLNLNIHFHTLLFDGVFYARGEGDTLDFRPLPPPTDEEVGVVLARIAARVQRLLKRRGFEASDADLLQADPVVEYSPALAGISSASIQGRIALGPRAGGRVWRVGADPDAPWVLSTAPRHAHLVGFDLHANVEVPAADRPRLVPLSAPAGGGAGPAAAPRRWPLQPLRHVWVQEGCHELDTRPQGAGGPTGFCGEAAQR